ncbi:MAG TPA: histidine phosphatase family protein [archaeon]|nr:histidine phosphatase family protein [archaeon]
MPVKITYFVHGTTTDNEKHLATGWAQGELSQKGIDESKKLGETVKEKFDAVFCSDLKRAVDSSKLAFPKAKIIKDKRLREADYGDFTQKPASLFKTKMAEYVNKKFPKGESYKDVEKRVRGFLMLLKKNYKGKHIAIVAHQAPQLALDVILSKKTWDQAIRDDWRLTGKWQPGWNYEIK